MVALIESIIAVLIILSISSLDPHCETTIYKDHILFIDLPTVCISKSFHSHQSVSLNFVDFIDGK